MSTAYPEIFAALAATFEPNEVKTRSHSGRQMQYVTARVVMNRLDSVLGPENWTEEYKAGENSVLCRLTITLPDGKTVTKADAGGYAGMADSGDDDKSGYSDAFKRAAVKFGVGRYLYRDGVPGYGEVPNEPTREPAREPVRELAHAHAGGGRDERDDWSGSQPDRTQGGNQYRSEGNGGQQRRPQQDNPNSGQAPRTGRALFARMKEMEQEHKIELLKPINQWMKRQNVDARIVDLTPEQVPMVYTEVCRLIDKAESQDDGWDNNRE